MVELGAGTGVVTEALLARGIMPTRLFVVERSARLAAVLKERFPEVSVFCGDAARLRSLLNPDCGDPARVDVVSSLPLRSLPSDQVEAILGEIAALIRTSGNWIQFTYALMRREVPKGFTRFGSSIVWGNLPPARVDVFTSSNGAPADE